VTAHLGRPPSTIELGVRIERTTTPVYRMLVRLEALGYVTKDTFGKFHVRPAP
jgi:DNA-binding IclR family transcriptional regulator